MSRACELSVCYSPIRLRQAAKGTILSHACGSWCVTDLGEMDKWNYFLQGPQKCHNQKKEKKNGHNHTKDPKGYDICGNARFYLLVY